MTATPAKKPVQTQNVLLGLLAILTICVICICLALIYSPDRPKNYRTMAYVICQLYVEDNLKSPSSAKFPASINSDIRELENNTWEIRSYVDAQNSFGADIRTDFYCKVQYIGTPEDDETLTRYWLLHDLQFSE